ncbi:MAG: fused MFS/spermidine synthase [Gammaproteobacteria bacterium]|nr:fused MFS/spermidine synthase [Gammaproteobacteria bacterium]MBU1918933.1 fused MFS/spermidine synthase [bacterium]
MFNNLTITRRASINWIMFIYFVSGACSLIDQVVWVRLIKLTLGNTVYATSIVVSVFLGGLALGALIMSRYSDRVVRHLQLYALLETLVTISALSLPFGLKLANNFYVWFYQTYQPSHAQLLFTQVIISTSLLLVPTMLMGSTLPLLGRFVTALEREAGHLVGKLYALNTLGAAVGCFLAGFVLIRLVGVMGTLYTAAILNLLVASGGWFLSSRFLRNIVEEQLEIVPTQSANIITLKTTDIKFYVLVLAFFLQGLISIGYELLWMRSIVHLLGGFTYVFSAVLTVYLLGNMIGVGIGSKLSKRLKEPAVGFAITLSVLGLFGILYLLLLVSWITKVLPHLNNLVFNAIYSWSPALFSTIKPLLQSVFLFLVPAIIMGIGFPLALQAWTNHMHKVGQSTGTAYGVNTIGAVIGGILTGFVLIPFLGLELSISILGLMGIWIGCIMYIMFTRGLKEKFYLGLRPGVVGKWAFVGVAVILTISTVRTSSSLFNVVIAMSPFASNNLELVAVKEGLTTTVSLHKNLEDDTLQLYSSGQNIAGDNYFLRGDQKVLGHFGIFLNSKAKRVLSVGFGSGETTACLAMHNLEQIDCVEIALEVVDVSLKFFKHINLGDKLNDKINMIYMDAKNYIHLTDNKYDVIINDSIHPQLFAENASLYTKEYFESAREHLNKEGMIISWLPLYDMSTSAFNSIIGTLMDVFPHVTVWFLTPRPAPLVLIVGSQQKQYFSLEHITNELFKENVGADLAEININNNMDVLSCYIADENDLKKHITTFQINSDYYPFVEFNIDRITSRQQNFKRFTMDIRSNSIYDHINWTGFSEKEKEKWIVDYQQLYNASTYLLMIGSSGDLLEQLKYCMEGLNILPDNPALLVTKKRIDENILMMGMTEFSRLDNVLVLAEQILKIDSDSATAWIIKADAIKSKGDTQKALIYAQKAVELAPDHPYAHSMLGSVFFKLKKFENAISEYKIALQLAEEWQLNNYAKIQLLSTLAINYATNGQIFEAITTNQTALDLALSKGFENVARSINEQLILLRKEYVLEPITNKK